MFYQCFVSIAAYSCKPSLALCAVSPCTRAAVERSSHTYKYKKVSVMIAPQRISYHLYKRGGSSSSSYDADLDVRTIDCSFRYMSKLAWWVRRDGLPVFLKFSAVPASKQRNYFFNVSTLLCDLAVYGTSLEGAALQDLTWLTGFPLLERLNLCCVTVNCATDFGFIAKLRFLSVLDIQSISLDSLRWITECVNLRKFLLESCPATVDLKPIGELHALESLSFSNMIVSCIEWVKQCKSLKKFTIHNAYYYRAAYVVSLRSVDAVAHLSFLTLLHLERTYFSSLMWLSACKHLEELYISRNIILIQECPAEVDLDHLRVVELYDIGMSGIYWISGCFSLQTLELDTCRFTNSDFSSVGKLKNLENLSIASTTIRSIAWLPLCTRLKCLMLNDLCDLKHLHPIGDLHASIQSINIWNMGYISTRDMHAASWLPKCAHLTTFCSGYSGNIACNGNHLRDMHSLKHLCMIHGDSTDDHTDFLENIDGITQCRHLVSLSLWGEKCIADFSPIATLRQLQRLNIKNTNVTSITFLRECTLLEALLVDLIYVTNYDIIRELPLLLAIDAGCVPEEEQVHSMQDSLTALLPYFRVECVHSSWHLENTIIATYDPSVLLPIYGQFI